LSSVVLGKLRGSGLTETKMYSRCLVVVQYKWIAAS